MTAPLPAIPPGPAPGGRVLVCGAGSTGRTILGELLRTGRSCSVVEKDPRLAGELVGFLPAERVVTGDATDEEALLRAGIRESGSLVSTLADDKLNLVVTVTALALHPGIRIVTRGTNPEQWDRLRREGAIVVSPHHIAGRRLATTLVHPSAHSFLADMLAAPSERAVRFEAVEVTAGSEADGKTLRELDLFARTGLDVVALRSGPAGEFLYNPSPATRLGPGQRIVVIGDWMAVDALARIAGRWERGGAAG